MVSRYRLHALQVITCSGVFQDGSLRILRSGIGINEQVSLIWLPVYNTTTAASIKRPAHHTPLAGPPDMAHPVLA